MHKIIYVQHFKNVLIFCVVLYAPGEYQKNPNTGTLRAQLESSVTSCIPHQFENRKLRWIKTDQNGQHTFCSSASLHRSTRRSRFIERMSRCLLKPLHDATATAAGVVRPMMESGDEVGKDEANRRAANLQRKGVDGTS